MMTKMMATMEEMKGELQELREERPRKKTEVKSEASFSLVSNQPK